MIIKSILINNFRCIRNLSLDIDNFTALTGTNGSGKSSILSAIEIFYDVSAPIEDEDFYNRNTSEPIEISVKYGDLQEIELLEFGSYISDNFLYVTKKISMEGDTIIQQYFSASPQIPNFAQIRNLPGKAERRTAINQLVDDGIFEEFNQKARSADQAEELMASFEQLHPELTELIEQEVQFFGHKNIGGGKLDKFTKFVRVPAVREVSQEIGEQRGTSFQKLLDLIVIRQINTREDIAEFRQRFEEEIQELYSTENLSELPELGEQMSEILQEFFPGASLRLQWDSPSIPEIKLPSTIPTLIEDSFEGEISRKGHGLQRALIMTTIQFLASLRIPDEEENSDVEINIPDLILSIDEPELFLHPNRCKYLANLLRSLTEGSGQGRNQIIITTHSPYFVGLDWFDQIRRISKVNIPPNPIPESIAQDYSISQASEQLATINNLPPENFSEESFRAHTIPIMTTILNEGLFGNVVVIVEGIGDASVLMCLQNLMGHDWDALGISVLPVGGKRNIDRPGVIFKGLQIPSYIIFDADRSHQGTSEENNTIRTNHVIQRLLETPEINFPDTTVTGTWACLEDNIEHLIQSEIDSQIYQEILEEVSTNYGYSERNVFKNSMCAHRFIELIYERGQRVPTLENIVTNISNLA